MAQHFPYLASSSRSLDYSEKDLLGKIHSLTPIAECSVNQTEPTTLGAALGSSFAGEAWANVSIGSSNWLSGTWFHSKNNTSASAVVRFTDWSSEPPFDGSSNTNGLVDQEKTVNVEGPGAVRGHSGRARLPSPPTSITVLAASIASGRMPLARAFNQ